MPSRRFKWWPNITRALSQPGNEYVASALNKCTMTMTKWDYDLLEDCINRRYRSFGKRRRTLQQIALDHGTTENVAWYTVKKFYFIVAEEMGYIKNFPNKNRKNMI